MADGRPEDSRTCEGQHGRSTEDAREGRGGHTGRSQDFHPSPEQQKWLSGFKDLGQFPSTLKSLLHFLHGLAIHVS